MKKILLIISLVGVIFLFGCQQENIKSETPVETKPKIQLNIKENSHLKHCGSYTTKEAQIDILKDLEHKKILYVASSLQTNKALSVAATSCDSINCNEANLQYCGTQTISSNKIDVFEDVTNSKMIYITTSLQTNYALSIAVN